MKTDCFAIGALYHEIIECLTTALEAKDAYTKGHSTRVADLVYDLAKIIGLRGENLEEIHLAAHLHDIGKIGIPDVILNKKGSLLPEEYSVLKEHSVIGYQILSRSEHLKSMARLVLYHHERWDGKGYPEGLRGEAMPLGSRIIAVCDGIDAMISRRPYREALTLDQCCRELERNSGTQFDPCLIQVIKTRGFSVFAGEAADALLKEPVKVMA
jgi:HD-GYP domain-containing protein (c-di-GMP phosphodiesterase class II)